MILYKPFGLEGTGRLRVENELHFLIII